MTLRTGLEAPWPGAVKIHHQWSRRLSFLVLSMALLFNLTVSTSGTMSPASS